MFVDGSIICTPFLPNFLVINQFPFRPSVADLSGHDGLHQTPNTRIDFKESTSEPVLATGRASRRDKHPAKVWTRKYTIGD